jgi:hypothetical protein
MLSLAAGATMTPETEIAHCRRRETEERLAAARALTDAAREAHFVMAERYADRVWSLSEAQADPLELGSDDIIDEKDQKISIFADAIVENHGDDALKVATTQLEAAGPDAASTWAAILARLQSRGNR